MTMTSRLEGLETHVAIKAPCRAATTANVALSGLQTIDGVSLASGDRVLVKDQTDTTENGIYAANSGDWERTQDFNGSRDVVGGTFLKVTQGTANANSYWSVSGSGSIDIGTDAIGIVASSGNITLQATLSASTGSNEVGFIQAGPGAVARTSQAKLREECSLFDIIPTSLHSDIIAGTCATDLRSYIVQALTNYRRIIVRKGEYRVFDEIAMLADRRVDFEEGAVIRQMTSGKRILYGTDLDNVHLIGPGLFKGVGSISQMTSSADHGLVTFLGTATSEIANAEYHRYEDIRFEDTHVGLFASGIRDLNAQRIRVRRFRRYAVCASKSQNQVWRDLNIGECEQSGADYCYGFMATGDRAGGFPQHGVSIIDPYIDDCTNWDAIMVHDTDDVTVRGGKLTNCRTAIDIGVNGAGNIIKRVQVHGIYAKLTQTNDWGTANAFTSGIAISGAGASAPIDMVDVSNNMVEDANKLPAGATVAAVPVGAIVVVNAKHVVVGGNVLSAIGSRFAGFTGVSIKDVTENLVIRGNPIDGDMADYAVRVELTSGSAENITITDNPWKATSTTATAHTLFKGGTFKYVTLDNQFGLNGSGGALVPFSLDTATVQWKRCQPLLGSGTYDPPSLAAGTVAATPAALVVTGAEIGDDVEFTFSADLNGYDLSNAWVSAANTVKCLPANPTSGPLDPVSGTLYAYVNKKVTT